MVDNQVCKFKDSNGQRDLMVQKTTDALESTKSPKKFSRRPLTRSQTGSVPKRSRRDDSPSESTKKFARAHKKIRNTSASPEELSMAPVDQSTGRNDLIPWSDTSCAPTGDSQSSGTLVINTPECFASTLDTSTEKRGTRLRANLPNPVPNLTKRSRGRRVPTRLPNEDSTSDSTGPTNRTYVCNVEACGKCFHRGEHLKRHIRSIHTHEKPFTCTHPLCNKNFNRHDNLLQHLKVHKDLITPDSSCPDDPGSTVELWQRTPPLTFTAPPQMQPYYTAREAFNSYTPQSRMSVSYLPPVSSIREYAAPYPSPFESGCLTTNMTVSSLRTEISHSAHIPRT